MKFTTVLPVPPSANMLYPQGKGRRRFKSAAYKTWQQEAALALKHQIRPLEGSLYARYEFHFPDRRIRDLPNFEKALSDFLVFRGVLIDDSQIDHMELIRKPVSLKSGVHITIQRMNEGSV